MDSQTNTGGGAVIQGDANAGRDVVGRDQINNIVIVGNLLHFAQIEGLFPKIQEADNFASLTEAVESALGARLSSDLAEATAFAGEIIGDFISTQIPKDPRQAIVLHAFIAKLVEHIGERLADTGHLEAFTQTIYRPSGRSEVSFKALLLEATNMLWRKQFGAEKHFYIGYQHNNKKYPCILFADFSSDITRFNTKQLRVIIAGIVLDLIRIKSDDSFSIEYLKGIAGQFRPK